MRGGLQSGFDRAYNRLQSAEKNQPSSARAVEAARPARVIVRRYIFQDVAWHTP
jgi:hypothetical protein